MIQGRLGLSWWGIRLIEVLLYMSKLFKGALSQGCCCVRSILYWSQYPVPLPIMTHTQNAPLESWRCQKEISSGNTNHNICWGFLQEWHENLRSLAQLFQVSIHVHPLQKTTGNSCLVCYTAVFSVVTQRSSLRDDTRNGCVED